MHRGPQKIDGNIRQNLEHIVNPTHNGQHHHDNLLIQTLEEQVNEPRHLRSPLFDNIAAGSGEQMGGAVLRTWVLQVQDLFEGEDRLVVVSSND